ncbi:Alg9-like mannosyltransferase family-domain-containing protein [Limtongia smithiae]|uniref:Alg9-like mannosyltransferase family-domain-containing protein n=1 Tax=Limtongia smithiae TaxID=1125753 RepID=UPI0034CF3C34
MSWKLAYLLLLIVRFYFTVCPSYIHPDEHFQGPEVIAGDIFGWDVFKTWEFTGDTPIRSILPLWFAYGFPMTILRWVFDLEANPVIVYYFLRMFFFLISFCLEDWALQELGNTPKIRAHYLLFVASSYVTWTYQTHTFSNSVETILVLWSLVLIKRISFRNFGRTSQFWSCTVLGSLVALGMFNRITFPAFLILPGVYLIPQFRKFPQSIFFIAMSGLAMSALAIYIDTRYYESPTMVITPLNNILYNSQTENLAKHGLHPLYTHVLVNLPILLGPYLLLIRPQLSISFLSAVSGTLALSLFRHQEARFLLPAVPLFLTATSIPQLILSRKALKWSLIGVIVVFNVSLALIFGIYHQGGVVLTQGTYVAQRLAMTTDVIWWKTYSPPDWLLGDAPITYIHRGGVSNETELSEIVQAAREATGSDSRGVRVWDMMGSDYAIVRALLVDLVAWRADVARPRGEAMPDILLVAPISSKSLYKFSDTPDNPFCLKLDYTYKKHLNLDDLGVDYEQAVYEKGGDTSLGRWEKMKLIYTQNRPGLGVWEILLRDS